MNQPHETKPLLTPHQSTGLQLRNRVVLAPLTRARAGAEGIPNELMAEYYRQRSGAGLIISEATAISQQASGWVHAPGIYTDEHEKGWKLVVDTVHEAGSKIYLQLWHTGRASHSSFNDGQLPVAPSPIAIKGEGVHTATGKQPHETPRALDIEEIPGLIQDYAKAAQRAKNAGFDGVEIHAANGYLLDQFLQSKTNQRNDEYGGSIEGRFRLLKEVTQAVCDVFGSTNVGVRLAPNGVFNDMGSEDYRETFSFAARELNKFGLSYLHVMDGLAFGFHELGTPLTLGDFREVFDGTLMGNCGYDEASANMAIDSGEADLIAFGRPFISNPDLVARFENDWPLAEDSDPSTWYLGDNAHVGYTDYPNYDSNNESGN